MKKFWALATAALTLSACSSTPPKISTETQIRSALIGAIEQHNAKSAFGPQETEAFTEDVQYLDLVPNDFIAVPSEPIELPVLPIDSSTGDVIMDVTTEQALDVYANDLAQYQEAGYLAANSLSISSCKRRVHQAHVSRTTPAAGDVISKGDVECTPSKNTIRVVAQMNLYKAANYTFPVHYASGPNVPMLTSPRVTTYIKQYDLWAHGPCTTGNYYGSMNMRYQNLQGGILAISSPLSGAARPVYC